ncbi:hypothetical protein As57867_022776, partial [Aphanomyces stellatus]
LQPCLTTTSSPCAFGSNPNSRELNGERVVLVTDFQDHTPEGANYVLPAAVIVSAMQQGISALATGRKNDSSGCHVELAGADNNHMRVSMKLKALSKLTAKYEFYLAPVRMARIDLLKSKIHDFQDEFMVKFQELQDELENNSTNTKRRAVKHCASRKQGASSGPYIKADCTRVGIRFYDFEYQ